MAPMFCDFLKFNSCFDIFLFGCFRIRLPVHSAVDTEILYQISFLHSVHQLPIHHLDVDVVFLHSYIYIYPRCECGRYLPFRAFLYDFQRNLCGNVHTRIVFSCRGVSRVELDITAENISKPLPLWQSCNTY